MHGRDIKCSDYHIIKIAYSYPKFDRTDLKILGKHQEMMREYYLFRENFIERFTGHNIDYWTANYMLDTYDCAYEYICEKYKMFVFHDDDDHIIYMIPNDNTEMIEWINQNLLLGNKVLKRCRLGTLSYRDESALWSSVKREYSREFTLEQREKHPNYITIFNEFDENIK